jgi:hypothetical protein
MPWKWFPVRALKYAPLREPPRRPANARFDHPRLSRPAAFIAMMGGLAVWMPSEGRYRVQAAPLHTMQILSQIARKERVDAADPANQRCLAELVNGGVLAPA